MRVRVKICGITSKEEAWRAVEAGADALGFVFTSSRRQIDPASAREICTSLPPMVSRVGVFVNPQAGKVNYLTAECGLDVLQFHGEESPAFLRYFAPRSLVKAVAIKGPDSLRGAQCYSEHTLLLDTYSPQQKGGTGKSFPWSMLEKSPPPSPFILAGGLNPLNIEEALEQTNPYGVDVSSGVETKGIKDPQKIADFLKKVRRWETYAAQ